jgi:hypothetical protein
MAGQPEKVGKKCANPGVLSPRASGIDCLPVPRRFVTALALVSLFIVGGCVRVKPYQREHLSKRAMESDRASGETRFEQHAKGSREGSDGGTGEAGGGCGCN